MLFVDVVGIVSLVVDVPLLENCWFEIQESAADVAAATAAADVDVEVVEVDEDEDEEEEDEDDDEDEDVDDDDMGVSERGGGVGEHDEPTDETS